MMLAARMPVQTTAMPVPVQSFQYRLLPISFCGEDWLVSTWLDTVDSGRLPERAGRGEVNQYYPIAIVPTRGSRAACKTVLLSPLKSVIIIDHMVL